MTFSNSLGPPLRAADAAFAKLYVISVIYTQMHYNHSPYKSDIYHNFAMTLCAIAL